jgi:hypothetical protein
MARWLNSGGRKLQKPTLKPDPVQTQHKPAGSNCIYHDEETLKINDLN